MFLRTITPYYIFGALLLIFPFVALSQVTAGVGEDFSKLGGGASSSRAPSSRPSPAATFGKLMDQYNKQQQAINQAIDNSTNQIINNIHPNRPSDDSGDDGNDSNDSDTPPSRNTPNSYTPQPYAPPAPSPDMRAIQRRAAEDAAAAMLVDANNLVTAGANVPAADDSQDVATAVNGLLGTSGNASDTSLSDSVNALLGTNGAPTPAGTSVAQAVNNLLGPAGTTGAGLSGNANPAGDSPGPLQADSNDNPPVPAGTVLADALDSLGQDVQSLAAKGQQAVSSLASQIPDLLFKQQVSKVVDDASQDVIQNSLQAADSAPPTLGQWASDAVANWAAGKLMDAWTSGAIRNTSAPPTDAVSQADQNLDVAMSPLTFFGKLASSGDTYNGIYDYGVNLVHTLASEMGLFSGETPNQ